MAKKLPIGHVIGHPSKLHKMMGLKPSVKTPVAVPTPVGPIGGSGTSKMSNLQRPALGGQSY